MEHDCGMDTLLDLDGSILDQGDGYWVKIEAKRVAKSDNIPHGIRYSLTLHSPSGERILGYDNAHSVRGRGRKKYSGQVLPFDHKHRHEADLGTAYEFESAAQLVSDFFQDVDRVLQEVR